MDAYTSVNLSDERLNQAKSDLLAILPAWPRLTLSGFWDDAGVRFQQERDALLSPVALRAFVAARAWLRRNAVKRPTLNGRVDSYALKHIIEEDVGYLPNGVAIAAVIAEGFAIKQCSRWFAINTTIALELTEEYRSRFPTRHYRANGRRLGAGYECVVLEIGQPSPHGVTFNGRKPQWAKRR